MSAFSHSDQAEQRFTSAGGYVLQQRAEASETPMRFAVTAGQDDAGVELTEDEAFDLGCWLLRQALPPNEWDAVRRRINLLPWKRDRDRADQLDAMASADP